MPDRERRRWADTATGLGLTGQTAAAGTTVTELAASWGTGQSAVRRRRRPRWRRPGPAGSTAARPRLMGLRHRFRANRARSFSILARFSGLAAVSLTRWVSSRPLGRCTRAAPGVCECGDTADLGGRLVDGSCATSCLLLSGTWTRGAAVGLGLQRERAWVVGQDLGRVLLQPPVSGWPASSPSDAPIWRRLWARPC